MRGGLSPKIISPLRLLTNPSSLIVGMSCFSIPQKLPKYIISCFGKMNHSLTKSAEFYPIDWMMSQACSHGNPNIFHAMQMHVLFTTLVITKTLPIETPNFLLGYGLTTYLSPFVIFTKTFSSILGPMDPFHFNDSSLCFTSMPLSLIKWSIKKVHIE